MKPSWSEPGYPDRHYSALRQASRSSALTAAVTGALCVASLAGAVYWRVPPIMAATAGVVFLLFGLYGGIAGRLDMRRHVRILPYFQRRIGGIDTYVAGRALARSLRQLDAFAIEMGVAPLSSFGFADDLQGEPLVWHSPVDGLRTVTTLLDGLERSAERDAAPADVMADLRKWRQALERAAAADVPFCVLLRHGDSTNAQEWELRQGSAF